MPKTFAEGEILTAQDLNENLNPATALGVPYAMAAGSIGVSIPNSVAGDAAIVFPAGRFNRAPLVIATINSSWKRYWVRAHATSSTSGTISLYAPAGATANETITVWWIAIQMQAGSAQG